MGEISAAALADEAIGECPFDHDDRDKTADNNLKGIGTTLREHMANGRSTRFGVSGVSPRPSPDNDPAHVLYAKATPIVLPKHTPDSFPLTCAAHHLIPAQASLRPSQLLQWLVHGAIAAQVEDGNGNGRLRHNIGYDVNGSENGVWLPGPYALDMGSASAAEHSPVGSAPTKQLRGAVQVLQEQMVSASEVTPNELSPADLDDEDDPHTAATTPAPRGSYAPNPVRFGQVRTSKPTRAPNKCSEPFPALYDYYFLYAVRSMQKVGGQYHDAHTDYNKRVLKALDEINTRVNVFAIGGACEKCQARNKKRTAASEDFPAPTKLLAGLDRLSRTLQTLLLNPLEEWKWPIYTSRMAIHHWVYERDAAIRSK